ncbi:NUDIX domain-containing protein [Nocardia sp. NPDC052254]|uniref:NUDIX hydrolase n=1 Tax=Nocardia sp. NPDC052254 TaxID=3155681 RepID=UPI0034146008
MSPATVAVAQLIRGISPLDAIELHHIDTALTWLAGTDDIFRRISRPATPAQHLVSYVVVVDPDERALLLGSHVKSGLWLPMGGHVEPGEHPLEAAVREASEEIGIEAEFTVVGAAPLFLTITTTVGDNSHCDVSLWYVVRGHRAHTYHLDPAEFSKAQWWDLDSRALPESDPHLGRFLTKLTAA